MLVFWFIIPCTQHLYYVCGQSQVHALSFGILFVMVSVCYSSLRRELVPLRVNRDSVHNHHTWFVWPPAQHLWMKSKCKLTQFKKMNELACISTGWSCLLVWMVSFGLVVCCLLFFFNVAICKTYIATTSHEVQKRKFTSNICGNILC